MSCEQYKTELTDAALGVLRPRDESAIRRHLARCEECRAELDERKRLIQAMDREIETMVAGLPSPAFQARVRQRVEEADLASGWWRPRWALVAGGAMAVLALVTVWFVRRGPIAPGNVGLVAVNPGLNSPIAPTQNTKPGLILKPHARRVSAEPGKPTVRRNEPEVLVEPGQDQAVVELYAAVWSGRVDPAPLLIEPQPLVPFPELKIEPLEIEELGEEARPLDRDPTR